MIRPRLALATFASLTLVAAAGAGAAESPATLWAQSADLVRGPGFYLNLYKFFPIFFLYLTWAWTTSWIDSDCRELDELHWVKWNLMSFFGGVLGFALIWLVPFYAVGLVVLLAGWAVPVFLYVSYRNKLVVDEDRVLTGFHLGNVANAVLNKIGMKGPFNRNVKAEQVGPPVTFVGKGGGDHKVNPELIEQAAQSGAYAVAKELVYDAVTRRATDIHLEPTAEQLAVRYRIDGILHPAEPFDRPTGDSLINVFKVLSALDIAEKRKPQDGSFGAKIEAREVDFRIATSGSKAGEKLVMRILDTGQTVVKLEEIGLRPKVVDEIRKIINQPSGMFLCCGPTGSGKTTTLYACLREIDRFLKNIITVEDTIEYQIDNVTQIQLSNQAEQTLAGTLRSVLRQEPDLVMIGEIRDQETAAIACQAASGGRMVFSAVNSTDTVTALFRLLDLGVEPFTIASSLSAILSQRLVRVLCEACKEPYKPKPEFLRKANLPADKVDVFYRRPTEPAPEGVCTVCGGTGYLGRTGIFELLTVTEPIRDLIRENPSVSAIRAEARKNGMIFLQEDGLRQVIQGRTFIEELLRVVK